MRNRTPRWTGAVMMALGCAVAGCGTEAPALQLGGTERLIDSEATATLANQSQVLRDPVIVGDLDGDGTDDAVVSTRFTSVQNKQLVAITTLYVAYGGSQLHGAIDLTTLPSLTLGDVFTTIEPIGDVDGDGLADFVATFGRSLDCNRDHAGAYLVYGSHTRLSGSAPIGNASAVLQDPAFCTETVHAAGLGDLDGDGKADFAISRSDASHPDGTPGFPSQVLVFYGRGQRLSGVVDLVATADATIREPVTGPNAPFVLGAGDLDGDGHSDLIVSTNTKPGPGYTLRDWLIELRLVRGSATRLAGEVALGDVASTRLPDITCMPAGRIGGRLGDLDGDGADDFSLADCDTNHPPHFPDNLMHRVFYGNKQGLPAQLTNADAAATITTASSDVISGNDSQLIGGDINGDGTRDLILADQSLRDSNGGVHLLLGSATRFSGTIDPPARAARTYVGTPFLFEDCGLDDCNTPEMVGVGVSLGDVTGDHHPDLLVGAAVWVTNRDGTVVSSSRTYVVSPPTP